MDARTGAGRRADAHVGDGGGSGADYTHDPSAFDGDQYGGRDATGEAESGARAEAAAGTQGAHPEAVDREFGRRGWVLVGAVVVAFLVIPSILLAYPHVGPMFGLGFWVTYLVLPLVPAVLLGALAVWVTTRP